MLSILHINLTLKWPELGVGHLSLKCAQSFCCRVNDVYNCTVYVHGVDNTEYGNCPGAQRKSNFPKSNEIGIKIIISTTTRAF